MFLKRNFSENVSAVLNINTAIRSMLAEAKANEKASKNLRCNILVNGEHAS